MATHRRSQLPKRRNAVPHIRIVASRTETGGGEQRAVFRRRLIWGGLRRGSAQRSLEGDDGPADPFTRNRDSCTPLARLRSPRYREQSARSLRASLSRAASGGDDPQELRRVSTTMAACLPRHGRLINRRGAQAVITGGRPCSKGRSMAQYPIGAFGHRPEPCTAAVSPRDGLERPSGLLRVPEAAP
jgi:hypothetical protein